MSDELIERLAAGLKPVSRLVVARRLGAGMLAGAAVSAALTITLLGLRPDIARAAAEPMFWMKFAYTIAIAAVAL